MFISKKQLKNILERLDTLEDGIKNLKEEVGRDGCEFTSLFTLESTGLHKKIKDIENYLGIELEKGKDIYIKKS